MICIEEVLIEVKVILEEFSGVVVIYGFGLVGVLLIGFFVVKVFVWVY